MRVGRLVVDCNCIDCSLVTNLSQCRIQGWQVLPTGGLNRARHNPKNPPKVGKTGQNLLFVYKKHIICFHLCCKLIRIAYWQ